MVALRYLPGMTKERDAPDNAAEHTAELLIHLARLAQTGDGRLTPAQWTALRFFARANRFSRTPSAFSEFHATTRGTASQTVKSLVALGLLERHRSESDGRSIRYDPTPEGRALLERDPLTALVRALERLPDGDLRMLWRSLSAAAQEVARQREAPQFGTCGDCSHLAAGDYCRCAPATLATEELGALCVDFAPRSG